MQNVTQADRGHNRAGKVMSLVRSLLQECKTWWN